jgi:mono/diheme cytochrome c family protein
MGSASRSFVLGFLPVQINRRPKGTGGVIEDTSPDELTQLQRLIDYGVVTGITSLADVAPLEGLEGSRAPRNDAELVAQGYLLGNCSHCHNPHGYPTVQNPVLQGVLDFLPSKDGGIFQFPLERYSPRIGRGQSGSTPIPYVTPSLMDLPRMQPGTSNLAEDIFTQGGPDDLSSVIYAPWRSLIYRNVDSAFAYTDDLALYPHMPMNTPGYDPRAKQIVADWMVSIPAVRKHPELPEYAFYDGAELVGGSAVDATPQPYVEVLPGDPAYGDAVAGAKGRLDVLHTGVNPALPLIATATPYVRYADTGETSDIVDPQVTLSPICHPIPTREPGSPFPFAEHPHWVVTDLSLAAGPWSPRNANWENVLVERAPPPQASGCTATGGQQAAYADQVAAVGLLQSATLDQVRAFVTTPLPFGLWKAKSNCDFSSVPTVQSFSGASRPHWMAVANPDPGAPVFSETPGAAVFKMICINCHGPSADAKGRMAQNLATMTGGLAQVADFRDGLFGPVGAPEDQSNRHLVFGALPSTAPAAWTGVTDDDRAARYMAWMALGGTEVHIPLDILEIIAVTHVLDQQRVLEASQLSANMLSQAKALCLSLLGPDLYPKGEPTFDPTPGHGYLDFTLNKPLISTNGDAELWLRLCSLANAPPVHLLSLASGGAAGLADVPAIFDQDFNLAMPPGKMVDASSYPPATPIGNESGAVDPSLSPGNEWPWCVDTTGATSAQQAWVAANGLPVCPAAIVAPAHACAAGPGTACFGNVEANTWAVRGAINAGFSVFLYVQSIEGTAPPPDYDHCELLP